MARSQTDGTDEKSERAGASKRRTPLKPVGVGAVLGATGVAAGDATAPNPGAGGYLTGGGLTNADVTVPLPAAVAGMPTADGVEGTDPGAAPRGRTGATSAPSSGTPRGE